MVDSPWECGVMPGSWGNSVGCCAGQCASGPIQPAKKNESIGEFEVLLEDLSALLEDQPWPSRVVVAGDFNARSDSWDPGCRENARGRLLAEWTSRSGLFLLNDKGHSTCVRPQGSSVVDLVWVTGIIRDRTTSCFVDDEESFSDHKLGAALISADWTRPRGTLGADAWVQRLRSSLNRACDIAMQRAGPGRGGRRKVHWWSEEVAARRRDANAARRKWTRARGKNRCGDVLAELREGCRIANRALKLAIAKAKDKSWRELLSSVDGDPWGRPYRLVMG
ncbi:hypothetical protein M0802_015464 [Mischocyttarus mexicanus]|nr:hypothetical protein M0802_015464 [Mischocyttarus mexicanus]